MSRYEETMKVLAEVMDIIYDTVKESGEMGAPSGPVYAALMSIGVSLDVYNAMIDSMVKAGRLRKSGHVLFAIEKAPT